MRGTQEQEWQQRAKELEGNFKIGDGLYLIGSLEKGVTVYSQQVRAHNLIWALWEIDKQSSKEPLNVAIVGAGIAGLTAAGCTLGLFPNARVTLFERSSDLCPLQQGCDSRWLHPRIYKWPESESRVPSASLPVLNWQEGRASDVADQILRGFGAYCGGGNPERGQRLAVYLGVDYLRVCAAKKEIIWIGRESIRDGPFFRAGAPVGQSQEFDRILLAVGFGMENHPEKHPTPSYWRNEQLAQPVLDGRVRSYIVSGYGDGALVDLCRLTVERFRQDRIVYDLFDRDLEETEERMRRVWQEAGNCCLYELLKENDGKLLEMAQRNLDGRIRKDTRVVLHLAGKAGANTAFADAFGNTSSFLNRLMLFLLYRRGAFTPTFDTLETLVKGHQGPPENIICRHGPDALAHVRGLFIDPDVVERTLSNLRSAPRQGIRREWRPGCFPN